MGGARSGPRLGDRHGHAHDVPGDARGTPRRHRFQQYPRISRRPRGGRRGRRLTRHDRHRPRVRAEREGHQRACPSRHQDADPDRHAHARALQGSDPPFGRARPHENSDASLDTRQGRGPLLHAALGDTRPGYWTPQSRDPPLPGKGAEQDGHPVRGTGSRRRYPPRQVEDARPVNAGGVLCGRRSCALSGCALALRRGRARSCRRHSRRAGRDGQVRDDRPRGSGPRRVRGRGRSVNGRDRAGGAVR